MKPRSVRRLLIIEVLVVSLVLTLLGRLYFVQMLDHHKPVQTAGARHDGKIVVPAPRGEIVDSRGQPLVTNRATYVVTVNRSVLLAQPDDGQAALVRLAGLLSEQPADLAQRITPCGVKVPSPCWTGQPYQPVPVATDAPASILLAIKEHQEDFPGVAIDTETVRSYPGGSLAAHELGYTGQVSATDKKADPSLFDDDTIGRTGLEDSYDSVLRGTDGYQVVQLDARGEAVGSGQDVSPIPGQTLVTSIDANVQKMAEKALADQIALVRKGGKAATGGAVIVMDPKTGRIIAAASYPTYDPQVFVGGISVADYKALTAPGAQNPLVSRAIAGEYAPGSTFKLVSASSDVMNGLATLTGNYSCPGSLNVDGRVKTNFDSEAIGGSVNLALALQYSCDTWFYKFAVDEYYQDQALISAGKAPNEYLQHMARAFGFASSAGVDLPADEQAVGSIADRETRQAGWEANKAQYCADAAKGYPDVADKTMRAYLTQLASENCTDGYRYRAGDNADLSIGQGETTVSPLQLAVAYSAMVNGGTVWNPTIGWAVEDAKGNVVKTITPTVKNKVPVTPETLAFIQNSLRFQNNH
ncbi:MAG: penicillin-binding protein 2, partial [Pseudonocardiales bacterium]|nr:penicillin-binding protein 2 [Pseudonocardiales bacterium]